MPQFVPCAGLSEVKSFRRSAWGGLKDGSSRVDSNNRPNRLVRVPWLDLSKVEEALGLLIGRHPALNVRLEDRGGHPWLVPCAAPPVLEVLDLQQFDRDAAEAAIGAVVWRPIDTLTGPLYRAYVVCFGDAEYYIGLVSHHFVSDAVSIRVLMRDFIQLYYAFMTANSPDLPPQALSYLDYLHAINEWIETETAVGLLDAMLERISSAAAVGQPRVPDTYSDFAEVHFKFDDRLSRNIRAAARSLKVSPFTLLVAAQNLIMHQNSGGAGSLKIITDGRETGALINIVGNMADRIHIVTDMDGASSYADVVSRTHEALAVGRRGAFVRDDFVQAGLAQLGVSPVVPVFNFRAEPLPRQAPPANWPRPSLAPPPPPLSAAGRPRDTYYLVIVDDGETLRGSILFSQKWSENFLSELKNILAKFCDDASASWRSHRGNDTAGGRAWKG